MRKLPLLISLILICMMVAAPAGTASAAPLGGGPTISPPSGGGTVTLTAIPISKLPGTEMNDVGTIFPQGHTNGDMMFSGQGASVSGLVGYATLSMPLVNYAEGWSGNIHQWLNESWVSLPTTITQNEEGPNAIASAAVYSDGIYALIIQYKLPDTGEGGRCKDLRFMTLNGFYDEPSGIYYSSGMIFGLTDPAGIAAGTEYSYRVISLDHSITFGGDVFGTVVVSDGGSIGGGLYGFDFIIPPEGAYVTHDGETDTPPFIFRVMINGCKVDYVVRGGGQ